MTADGAPWARPVRRVRLDLRHHELLHDADEPLRLDLSVCEQAGTCLWLASDETASVERLTTTDFEHYGQHRRYALGDLFDLPEGDAAEVDIEGLAMDGPFLWVVGSHSLRRRRPKPQEHDPVEALARLSDIRHSANRYLLGRMPMVPTEAPGVFDLVGKVDGPAATGPLRAACLRMRGGGNKLVKALSEDPHLAPFLGIPAKENGFDIEGLAARGDRVFLGLRGPVLRGWALVIEIEVREKSAGRLKLRKIGPDGRRYRKHFLDLGGLGIRELCLDGDDLLILAGPTMDLSGPVVVHRWPAALGTQGEALVPRDTLEHVLHLPHGDGTDHAEGLALFRQPNTEPRLLVVYDSPGPDRLHPDGTSIDADLFDVPARSA